MTNQEQIPIERKITQKELTQKIKDLEKELKVLNLLAVPIILSTYIFFIYLTYNPPHNYIFYDTVENKYSINDYTNKISTS